MKDRVQELASLLRRQSNPFLAAHPTLKYTWRDEGAIVTLTFPPADDTGFEVAIQVGNDYAYVLAGRSHQSFNLRGQSPSSEIDNALAAVRDLLSTKSRMRELRSGGKPYGWFVERLVDGRWRLETSERIPFYNYFGRRSEHVYQNKQLPTT